MMQGGNDLTAMAITDASQAPVAAAAEQPAVAAVAEAPPAYDNEQPPQQVQQQQQAPPLGDEYEDVEIREQVRIKTHKS